MQSTACSDDFSLIREAQCGKHAASEKLAFAHDQSVLRVALRITGSQIDARDIYQETFLRAFTKLSSFRFECAFSTWIYRIATNVCLDYLRKKRTRKETSATEVNADGDEYDLLNQVSDDRTPSSPEQQILGRELVTQISLALTKLTPRERIIFELKHYQGLTLRTLSRILNCSEATIKVTRFRATRKLRLHLADSYLGRNCSARHAVVRAV
jgi:RNA polymerase sigma-70 factor (ECF subfamily)